MDVIISVFEAGMSVLVSRFEGARLQNTFGERSIGFWRDFHILEK